METDWWNLIPDQNRTPRIPEALLGLDGRVCFCLSEFVRFHHCSKLNFGQLIYKQKHNLKVISYFILYINCEFFKKM